MSEGVFCQKSDGNIQIQGMDEGVPGGKGQREEWRRKCELDRVEAPHSGLGPRLQP